MTNKLTKIRFSVVIPAYKEERTLPTLLESISKQTLQPTEVIVADNNSPDKTAFIAKQFGCKVVKGGNSPGIGRNEGAKYVKTDIICFLDADDVLNEKDFFKRNLSKFTKEKIEVGTSLSTYNPSSTFKGKLAVFGSNIGRITNLLVYKILGKIVFISGQHILVSKNAFASVGGFDTSLSNGEDTEFVRSVSKNGYKFDILPVSFQMSGRRYNHATLTYLLKVSVLGFIYWLGRTFNINWALKMRGNLKRGKGNLGG